MADKKEKKYNRFDFVRGLISAARGLSFDDEHETVTIEEVRPRDTKNNISKYDHLFVSIENRRNFNHFSKVLENVIVKMSDAGYEMISSSIVTEKSKNVPRILKPFRFLHPNVDRMITFWKRPVSMRPDAKNR